MGSDVEVNHLPPLMSSTTKTNSRRKVTVGTTKKSVETNCEAWSLRKARATSERAVFEGAPYTWRRSLGTD
jgi:hypothetical protein